jgi:hypothetical protein
MEKKLKQQEDNISKLQKKCEEYNTMVNTEKAKKNIVGIEEQKLHRKYNPKEHVNCDKVFTLYLRNYGTTE